MPAIITDQFRILNAETFAKSFTGIGTTTNYYYTFLGHPNPKNDDIVDYGDDDWGDVGGTPIPKDSFKEENLYHGSMLFLKRVSSSDVRRVVRRYNWELGITYDMYRNNYDLDNKSPQSSSTTLYGSRFFIVNSEFKVYACLNNGANPEFPNGQKSLVEPNFVDVSPQKVGTGSDGYVWKYLFTISPSDVVKFTTDDYIPLPADWGDSSTATVKNAAVKGKIEEIIITSRGSGYSIAADPTTGEPATDTGTVTGVPILGDGVGGFAAVSIQKGLVDDITVTNGGTGYTKGLILFDNANISNLGAGTGATFEIIIPPQGGHGADVYRELGGNRVMVYSKYDTDPDYVQGVDFSRIGLIKNPIQNKSETEPLDTSTATALGALKLAPTGTATTTSNTKYPIDAVIKQQVGVGSTAVGYVASWNKDTGVLRYYQPVGLTGITVAGNKLLNFASGAGTGTINCDTIEGPALIVDEAFDNQNSINTGSKIIELGQTFEKGIAPPDVNRHSGEIIYIDNRAPITRSAAQKEEVKIVVEF